MFTSSKNLKVPVNVRKGDCLFACISHAAYSTATEHIRVCTEICHAVQGRVTSGNLVDGQFVMHNVHTAAYWLIHRSTSINHAPGGYMRG